jgi:outer membrane protein assembly factor BamB
MIRRLAMAWAALGALAWAVPTDGQSVTDPRALPDQSALQRIGLERSWFVAVPLRTGLEQVNHLSLTADGTQIFAQTTEAQLYCYDSETGRLQWTSDLGPASGLAQDVGVYPGPPDLQLIPSFEMSDELPSTGRYLVVVAKRPRLSTEDVNDEILHFRVFDSDGSLSIDSSEDEYRGKSRQISDLKRSLAPLWGQTPLTLVEKNEIISKVTALIQYAPATLAFATNGNFMHAIDRATGRKVWSQRMESNASSPVAATLDLVMVGLANGKLHALSLENAKEQRFQKQTGAPGGFAWNFSTTGPIIAEPIPTQKVVAFASTGGKLYVSTIDPPQVLHRSQPMGEIVASMASYGTGPESLLIVPSTDRNLYGINLFTGEQRWVFPTGAPNTAQPLVGGGASSGDPGTQADQMGDPTVYVLNEAGQLFAIDPENGQSRWNQLVPVFGTERERIDPETGRREVVRQYVRDPATGGLATAPKSVGTAADQILALSPTRIYLVNGFGDLAIVDRATGELLAGPADTLQRAGVNLRSYSLANTNDVNDRIYLASPGGSIVCLREIGATSPAPLRESSSEAFGYLGDPNAPQETRTPPVVPVAPGGLDGVDPANENPFDLGFGSIPARP